LKKYETHNPLVAYAIQRFLSSIKDMLSGVHPKTVLDVGCGEGIVLKHTSDCGTDVFNVGLDISKSAVKIAKHINPKKSFCVADAAHLPFKSSSFELVMCCEVLEHLDEPEVVIEECGRVSSKACLSSVPNKHLFRLANMLRLKNLSRWGEDKEHRHAWTKNEFVELMSRDLHVCEVRQLTAWVIVLASK